MSESNHNDECSWQTLPALPDYVVKVLERTDGREIAVVATVDKDGAPRTAAFGSVRAISAGQVRFACNRQSATFSNLVRDGRVMIACYSPPNLAVGIRGRARVIKEQLEALPTNALVQVDVEQVKNDSLPTVSVATAMTYGMTDDIALLLGKAMAELQSTA